MKLSFLDIGNDPEPIIILIDLACQKSAILYHVKVEDLFLVFIRSSYLIEETLKVIKYDCIVSIVNFFS